MTTTPSDRGAAKTASLERYWRTNLAVLLVLLAVWAAAGLGCGVMFADALNQYRFPGSGIPLGFWFAQQGSIIVFVVLILVYCIVMNRLDAHHLAELHALDEGSEADPPAGPSAASDAEEKS